MTLKLIAEKVKISCFNMIPLLNEVELYSEWFPFCKKAEIVIIIIILFFQAKQCGKAKKVVDAEFSFPFPLKNRTACLYGFGVNRQDINGSLFIASKGIESIKDIETYPHLEEFN